MRGWRIGEASHLGPPARREVDLDEDTQDTIGGSTPTTDYHVGPDMEMLSQLEMHEIRATLDDLFGEEVHDAAPEELLVVPPPPPVFDQRPPLRRCVHSAP